MSMFETLIQGFAMGAALIVAIGAQNAFVLKQGLLRRYLLLTALVCALLDGLLIASGVLGLGKIVSAYPFFVECMRYFAAIFLFVYGIQCFRSALKAKVLHENKASEIAPSLKGTLLMLLTLSLLNPHAYLDTVILLGSIAAEYPSREKIYFAAGATMASFVWFFTLTYGARILNPLFKKAASWRVVDCITGAIMWSIGVSLFI